MSVYCRGLRHRAPFAIVSVALLLNNCQNSYSGVKLGEYGAEVFLVGAIDVIKLLRVEAALQWQ